MPSVKLEILVSIKSGFSANLKKRRSLNLSDGLEQGLKQVGNLLLVLLRLLFSLCLSRNVGWACNALQG